MYCILKIYLYLCLFLIKIQYLKKVQEDLLVENKSLLNKTNLLEKQIKNFEEQAEKSMCEVERNEIQDIQGQLNVYMLNNVSLILYCFASLKQIFVLLFFIYHCIL